MVEASAAKEPRTAAFARWRIKAEAEEAAAEAAADMLTVFPFDGARAALLWLLLLALEEVGTKPAAGVWGSRRSRSSAAVQRRATAAVIYLL